MVLKKFVSPAEKHGYFEGGVSILNFTEVKKLQLRTNSLKGWKFPFNLTFLKCFPWNEIQQSWRNLLDTLTLLLLLLQMYQTSTKDRSLFVRMSLGLSQNSNGKWSLFRHISRCMVTFWRREYPPRKLSYPTKREKENHRLKSADWERILMEEILHQLIWSISHYLQCFIHVRWLALGFLVAINSTSMLVPRRVPMVRRCFVAPSERSRQLYNISVHEFLVASSRRNFRTTAVFLTVTNHQRVIG